MEFVVASQVLVLVSLVGYAVWVRARRSALERAPQSGSPRTTAHGAR
jgi:hypothetical protein